MSAMTEDWTAPPRLDDGERWRGNHQPDSSPPSSGAESGPEGGSPLVEQHGEVSGAMPTSLASQLWERFSRLSRSQRAAASSRTTVRPPRLRRRAWAFSRAFARLGDSQLAEDAVQEAFVEAYRNLASLEAPEASPSWFQKALATACNRMTRRKTVVTIPLIGTEEAIQDGTSPSSNLERLERDRMVNGGNLLSQHAVARRSRAASRLRYQSEPPANHNPYCRLRR